jgi:hypothetical protein
MPIGKPITDDVRRDVIDFYLSKPMTYKCVCEKFNLSEPTVIKILKDTPKHTKSKIYSPNLNESIFEEINDEMSAYFLGLIISDGNVFEYSGGVNRQDSVSITLQECDEYLLDEFRKWTKTSTNIGHDGRGSSTVAIRSNKVSENLKKWGVVPRKSFITYLPKIDDKYMSHLIRGIFDGDGSIRFERTSRRFLKYMTICGSEQLIYDVVDYIFDNLKLSFKPKIYSYKNRSLFEFKLYNYEDMKAFGDFMYKDSTVYLKRKKEKFDAFLKAYENYKDNTEISMESKESIPS